MAKFSLICLVAIAFVASAYGNTTTSLKLAATLRNARFQTNLGKVAIEKQCYELYYYQKSEAKNDEQKKCLEEKKDKAITESGVIVQETLGKVLPELEQAKEDLKAGKEDQVQSMLDKLNYPEYKKNAMALFKQRMGLLIPQIQKEMQAECMSL